MTRSACCVLREAEPPLIKYNRFNNLTEDERLYKAFDNFLHTEYCQENLHFYIKVKELEECTDIDECKEKALEIAKEFLGIGGAEQKLTIPLHYKQSIEKSLKKRKINNKIYLEARMDVEYLLKTKYVAFCSI